MFLVSSEGRVFFSFVVLRSVFLTVLGRVRFCFVGRCRGGEGFNV